MWGYWFWSGVGSEVGSGVTGVWGPGTAGEMGQRVGGPAGLGGVGVPGLGWGSLGVVRGGSAAPQFLQAVIPWGWPWAVGPDLPLSPRQCLSCNESLGAPAPSSIHPTAPAPAVSPCTASLIQWPLLCFLQKKEKKFPLLTAELILKHLY